MRDLSAQEHALGTWTHTGEDAGPHVASRFQPCPAPAQPPRLLDGVVLAQGLPKPRTTAAGPLLPTLTNGLPEVPAATWSAGRG